MNDLAEKLGIPVDVEKVDGAWVVAMWFNDTIGWATSYVVEFTVGSRSRSETTKRFREWLELRGYELFNDLAQVPKPKEAAIAELNEYFDRNFAIVRDIEASIEKYQLDTLKRVSGELRRLKDKWRRLRVLVAKYMRSEGCDCCDEICKLLRFPKYEDGSGYNWYSVASKDDSHE